MKESSHPACSTASTRPRMHSSHPSLATLSSAPLSSSTSSAPSRSFLHATSRCAAKPDAHPTHGCLHYQPTGANHAAAKPNLAKHTSYIPQVHSAAVVSGTPVCPTTQASISTLLSESLGFSNNRVSTKRVHTSMGYDSVDESRLSHSAPLSTSTGDAFAAIHSMHQEHANGPCETDDNLLTSQNQACSKSRCRSFSHCIGHTNEFLPSYSEADNISSITSPAPLRATDQIPENMCLSSQFSAVQSVPSDRNFGIRLLPSTSNTVTPQASHLLLQQAEQHPNSWNYASSANPDASIPAADIGQKPQIDESSQYDDGCKRKTNELTSGEVKSDEPTPAVGEAQPLTLTPCRRSFDNELLDLEKVNEWKARFPSILSSFDSFLSLSCGKRLVVFLDYDGTLTPIVSNPELAFMSDGMRDIVRKVGQTFPTAIISGRGRNKVEQFVQLDELFYAGSHGLDIKGPVVRTSGGEEREALPLTLERGLDTLMERVKQRAEQWVSDIPGATVEDNLYSVSIHYRNCKQEDWPKVAAIAQQLSERFDDVHMTRGRKVFEIRPQVDWDKGKALLHLLRALGLDTADVIPLYIGDDRTDEDAFRVLEGFGIGILVSNVAKPTAARFVLSNPDEVGMFLERIVEWGQSSLSNGWHHNQACVGWSPSHPLASSRALTSQYCRIPHVSSTNSMTTQAHDHMFAQAAPVELLSRIECVQSQLDGNSYDNDSGPRPETDVSVSVRTSSINQQALCYQGSIKASSSVDRFHPGACGGVKQWVSVPESSAVSHNSSLATFMHVLPVHEAQLCSSFSSSYEHSPGNLDTIPNTTQAENSTLLNDYMLCRHIRDQSNVFQDQNEVQGVGYNVTEPASMSFCEVNSELFSPESP